MFDEDFVMIFLWNNETCQLPKAPDYKMRKRDVLFYCALLYKIGKYAVKKIIWIICGFFLPVSHTWLTFHENLYYLEGIPVQYFREQVVCIFSPMNDAYTIPLGTFRWIRPRDVFCIFQRNPFENSRASKFCCNIYKSEFLWDVRYNPLVF